MIGSAASRLGRLTTAATAAAIFVVSAPFIGQARSWLRTTFPERFTTIVGGALALLLAAAVVAAARRIKTHRARRYAAIAASLATAAVFARWRATGRPEVDVVELFHFLEYGVLTFLFYRVWADQGDTAAVVLPVMAGLIVGTWEEWFQWFIPARVGELNDIFLNLVAIGCGLVFSLAVAPPPAFSAHLAVGSRRALGRVAAAAIASLACFVAMVHIGYTIEDAETGSFESRFSEARLLALNATKAQAWAIHPLPLTIKRLSREDQYMSEGLLHVQARNDAWAADDMVASWRENRILEKYYEPVLDAPSYVSKTGHRWPAEQRTTAARRVGEAIGRTPPRPNRPYPYILFKWHTIWFVDAAAAAVLLALVLGEWSERRARQT
jgi:VanZ family protein